MSATTGRLAICQHIEDVYGPHAGCAEFVNEPETSFSCGGHAIVRFVFAQNPFGGVASEAEVVLCKTHAEVYERQTESGELLRQIPLVESMEIERKSGEPTTLVMESHFVSGYKGATANRVKDVAIDRYLTDELSPKDVVRWVLDRDFTFVPDTGKTVF